jgi:hypothetical protein
MDYPPPQEMSPHSIHHRPREVRILGRCHPAGERRSRIIKASEFKVRAAKRARRHYFAATRLDDASGRRQEDCLIRWHLGVRKSPFASHASEDGRKSVVIVLSPTFGGMVMTLSALNSYSQESLRHRLHVIWRRTHASIPNCGRVRLLIT